MVLVVESGIELLKVYPREGRIAVETWGTAIAAVCEHLQQLLAKQRLFLFSGKYSLSTVSRDMFLYISHQSEQAVAGEIRAYIYTQAIFIEQYMIQLVVIYAIGDKKVIAGDFLKCITTKQYVLSENLHEGRIIDVSIT